MMLKRLIPTSLCLLGLLAMLLTACRQSSDGDAGQTPLPAVDLTVIVVDDGEIAEEIRRRWELEGDEESELTVTEVTADEFFRDDSAWTGDVVIYPSRAMGELVARGWIEPLSADTLDSENLGWGDVFPLLRLRECTWDSQTYGVTLGSPVPVLFYRNDVFAEHDWEPPATWSQYAAIVEQLRGAKPSPWTPAVEPLAGRVAAHILLARAASYASHPGTLSVLFDTQTMQARIAAPPLVRAAEQLRDVATEPMLQQTPEDALRAVLEGRCAMAIGYLSSMADISADAWEQVSIAPLPGAEQQYNRRAEQWDSAEPDGVPLLGTRGRTVSIAKRTSSRVAASQLLVRLAGYGWGDEIAPKSHATTAYRAEHVDNTTLWGPAGVPVAITQQYLRVQAELLDGRRNVLLPRLRGGQRLDNALATAVQQIVRGEQSVEQALSTAAQQWEAIVAEEMPDDARQQYRQSEGL